MSAEPQGTGPSRRVGDYELVHLLGHGGMAEVWLARRRGPGKFERKVVIKRILPQHIDDASFVQMFVAEARLSARLSHPNIVAVHELGEKDGLYYIVMEYVHGRDLRSILLGMQDGRPIDPGLGAFVVRDLARALGYAHDVTDDEGKRLRLIHRDVSPSNVVVSFDGNVKLVDFGIAKALDEVQHEHTRTGSLKGKIGYMAPEQLGAAASSIDHRADLWAAGVVLWETLTGRRLFRGVNEIHTLDLVRSGQIDPPSKHTPTVPPELDRIALKALSRDLDERYQTGNDLAHDLDRVVSELRFGSAQMAKHMRLAFHGDTPAGSPGPHSGSIELPVDVDSAVGLHPGAAADWSGDDPTPQVSSPPSVTKIERLRPIDASRPRRFWIPALASVVVLGGLVAFGLQHHAEPVVVAPAVPTPAPVVTPPVRATNAKLHVDSSPRGALVFVGAEEAPRGETPLDLVVPLGTARLAVRAEQPGYVSVRDELIPDHDDTLYFSLAPEPPKDAPPKRGKHR